MPQRPPAIGDDVTALMGGGQMPEIGADVSDLMGADFSDVKGGSSATQAQRPSFGEMVRMGLEDNPALPPVARAGQGVTRFAKNNPVAAGAMAGGILAAPMTGGASLLGGMAAAGLGSAGGAGVGIAGRQIATGRPESAADTLGTMGSEGVAGVAGQGIGRAVPAALKLAGRGFYRAAALPINKMSKYGDLISEGLENRVPVGKSGLAKTESIKASRIAKKAEAIADADTRVSFRPQAISADAAGPLTLDAQKMKRAAQGNPMDLYDAKLAQFEGANAGGLKPSELEGIKSTLDDRLGGAYKKQRMKEAITPRERVNMELSHAASRAQESVVPGYKAMNKDVMNAEGLRQMIQRRVSPGSSGGNQGLENAMMIAGGPMAIPARLAMLPPVISRVGIAANEAGKASQKVAPPFLRALMAQLAAGSPDSPENQEQ